MPYRTDYHIHTIFSDGKASPLDYVKRAAVAGISELGFSEHLSLFRENQEWCMDPENAGNYIGHLEQLKNNSEGIIIRKGLEIDYYPGKEEELGKFLDTLDLDYRIGSVHYLGEKTVDNGPDFYEGKDIDRLFDNYFDTVIAAVSSGLFDFIAHCDLIRIYGFKPAAEQQYNYRRLAQSMKKYDVAFEVNTNGRNRPLADFYPDRRYLNIFREEGVPVCINSDAHFPERLGQFFDEAYLLVEAAGYTETATFTNRKRTMRPIRG